MKQFLLYTITDNTGNNDTFKVIDQGSLEAALWNTVTHHMFGSPITLDTFRKGEVAHVVEELKLNGVAKFGMGGPYPMYLYEEHWPFRDDTSGALLQQDRYYGFADAGGVYGLHEGYSTRQGVIQEVLRPEYGLTTEDLSHELHDLGGVGCCVLSGREYVNRLYQLCHDNADTVETWGAWKGREFS